tara:strand:- start:197 stop:715 length:519 start_codon:yes stop_codon:yes gene_type:complete
MKISIFNWANFTTLLRIVFTIVTIFAIIQDRIYFAVIFFLLAAATDKLDGYIARKFKLESKFGGYFDTIADFIFVIGIGIAFISKFTLTNKILLVLILPIVGSLFIFIYLKRKSLDLPHRFSSRILMFFLVIAILLFLLDFKYANEFFISVWVLGFVYTLPDYIINVGIKHK